MRIRKSDLTLRPNRGYGASDLPWGTSFHDIPLSSKENYDIYIGKFKIATIWKTKFDHYVVQEIHAPSKFKSLNHALRGLLRRLNSKE